MIFLSVVNEDNFSFISDHQVTDFFPLRFQPLSLVFKNLLRSAMTQRCDIINSLRPTFLLTEKAYFEVILLSNSVMMDSSGKW